MLKRFSSFEEDHKNFKAVVAVEDNDKPGDVFGILIVRNHTVPEIMESFADTKKAYGDEWCVEDLISNLPSDWEVTWLDMVSEVFV